MFSFKIKNSKHGGKGLYSDEHLPANHVLMECVGKLVSKDEMLKLSEDKASLLLQITNDTYLDMDGNYSFFINHSCNPNTFIKTIGKKAFLISTREISPNEEICFDYSLTSTETENEWKMLCNCGSWNCRKLITGFNALSKEQKEQYIKNVPDYVKKQVKQY